MNVKLIGGRVLKVRPPVVCFPNTKLILSGISDTFWPTDLFVSAPLVEMDPEIRIHIHFMTVDSLISLH